MTAMNTMRKITLQVCIHLIDNLLFFQVDDELQLTTLAGDLASNGIEHKLWIEQPENIAVCIAIKPMTKSRVHAYVKQLKLFI